MTKVRLVMLVIGVTGCTSFPDGSNWMYHEVVVPREYRAGRYQVFQPLSDVDRYVDMYERGWWSCAEDCALDIDHKYTNEPWEANGWPSAIHGYADGYLDADARIKKLIRVHGKVNVQNFLLELTTLGEYPAEERIKHRYKD